MSDARSLTPRLPEAKLLIDGESVAPLDGGTVPVTNPATGEKEAVDLGFVGEPETVNPEVLHGWGRRPGDRLLTRHEGERP